MKIIYTVPIYLLVLGRNYSKSLGPIQHVDIPQIIEPFILHAKLAVKGTKLSMAVAFCPTSTSSSYPQSLLIVVFIILLNVIPNIKIQRQRDEI